MRSNKLLASLLVITFLTGVTTQTTNAQTIQINKENKTIAISTTDEATATADIAAITIGFEIFKPDAETASAEGSRLSHSIVEALHKAGVDDKSIESKSQGVTRNTNFDDKDSPSQRAQRQFSFSQTWVVTANPKDAATILRVALAAGANESGNIDWRFSDRKALQATAAANALVKARSVANQMSEGLHVKLGTLVYASNETPVTKLYFPTAAQTVTVNAEAISSLVRISAPPLEIRPQTIREEATVYAVFSIE